MTSTYDIICVGAGPTGLATAIEAKRAGMRVLAIDKGCLCNSLYHYPVNMVFFTTPELLEIGDLPFVCAAEKPTRMEALKYYRKAAEHYELELRLGEAVVGVDGADGNFTVSTRDEHGGPSRYSTHKLVLATGYYDLPNRLNVPGEDLPHVSHYYTEPHSFWRRISLSSAARIQPLRPRWTCIVLAHASRSCIAAQGSVLRSNTGFARTSKTALRQAKSTRCLTHV